MRAIYLLPFLMIPAGSLAWAAPGEPVASGLEVYWVDPQRVVQASEQGKAAKQMLESTRASALAELRRREDDFLKRRPRLDPERYLAEASELEAAALRAQTELEKQEERLLKPLLGKTAAIVQMLREKQPEIRVLDSTEHPLVEPAPACDATDWVIAALPRSSGADLPPLVRNPRCTARHFLQADFELTLAKSKDGQKAAADLDKLQRRLQSDVDARRAKLEEAEAKASGSKDRAKYFRALDALQTKHRESQTRLAQEEERRKDALYARLDRLLVREAKRRSGVLVVEKTESTVSLPLPSCDVTSWLVSQLDGTAGESLSAACPGLPPVESAGARSNRRKR